MLTGKQKRFLRAKAHHLKADLQIGKQGVNENLLLQIIDYLEKNELMKISILQNCMEDKHTVAEQLEAGTAAEVVQIIGNNIILYKESLENKSIHLPN